MAWPALATRDIYATATTGKRRRDESHVDRVLEAMNGGEMPSLKRVRGGDVSGILETAPRAHPEPVAGIPNSDINSVPKQPVRGAEGLTAPDPHGLHRRSLSGPSPRQG
jgi:hypothetical protein